MRVLVFGDSITQGYWDPSGGWVDHIRSNYDTKQLEDLRTNDEPTIFNLGISADNSSDIVKRIGQETKTRIRHGNQVIVLVQIGVNDSSVTHGSTDVSVTLEEYGDNLRDIQRQLKTLPAKLIFVGSSACDETMTTPVFWVNIDYTNDRIKMYEDSMMTVAEELGIPFIPVFDQFKAKLDKGSELLADGLHPNQAGHQFIASVVLPKLDKLITSR